MLRDRVLDLKLDRHLVKHDPDVGDLFGDVGERVTVHTPAQKFAQHILQLGHLLKDHRDLRLRAVAAERRAEGLAFHVSHPSSPPAHSPPPRG